MITKKDIKVGNIIWIIHPDYLDLTETAITQKDYIVGQNLQHEASWSTGPDIKFCFTSKLKALKIMRKLIKTDIKIAKSEYKIKLAALNEKLKAVQGEANGN